MRTCEYLSQKLEGILFQCHLFSAWEIGYGPTLSGIRESCSKFTTTFYSSGNSPIRLFHLNLFPKFTTCGNTAQDNYKFSRDQPPLNRLAMDTLK